jgi:outer membrane biosynthesis protein TonB
MIRLRRLDPAPRQWHAYRMLLAIVLLLGWSAPAQTQARTNADLETRAPALIRKTAPEYTAKARRANSEGTVVLYVEVGVDGRVHNLRVIRHLGLGLDEKAI